MEFAVVDIETTGSHAKGHRITEIAVAIYDGRRLIDFWETPVNPRQPIPRSITALTGIDDDLVQTAPTFDEVAPTVFNLLSGRIFVAHNVNFDYTFLKSELAGC
ncbi:MAG TPA: exonuclease domain-containing protein, partial [Flavobacterium sp.]|nr:exonuclease domain-containing protein [Flavobacterium sp.]